MLKKIYIRLKISKIEIPLTYGGQDTASSQ